MELDRRKGSVVKQRHCIDPANQTEKNQSRITLEKNVGREGEARTRRINSDGIDETEQGGGGGGRRWLPETRNLRHRS